MSILKRVISLLLCVVMLTSVLASCDTDNSHNHETGKSTTNQPQGSESIHTHTPATAVTENYVEATCTKTGSYDEVVYCSECQEEISRTQKTVDKKPHDHNQKVTTTEYLKTEATCTDSAVYYYSCSCGDKGTASFREGDPSDHVFELKNTDSKYLKSPATETTPAVYYYSCVCGQKGTQTFTDGAFPEHTHIFDQENASSTYQKSPATCTDAAVYYYSCSCGEKGSSTFTSGTTTSHTEGDWVILKDSTCTENGIKFRKCAICGEEEFDYVNPTHKWVEATCLSAKKCELCGKTEGSLVDHEYVNGTCIFCGKFNYQEGLTYDGSPVTIRFYSTMGRGLVDAITPFIEEFQTIYPNITVEHTQPGGYDEIRNTIRAEITVNKQPNIAFCYPDHVAMYNRSGKVITLDDFISSTAIVNRADGTTEPLGLTQAQIDDIIEGFYNEGKQFGDNYMYTLPFSKSTEVLYYNATFFEEHDLKVPTTWDELEEVCRKIKAIDPNSIPLGYDSEANWFITMCEQYKSPYTSATGEHYLFDNQTNRDFVKRFAQWHSEGLVTTKGLIGVYTSSLFVGKKSYMCIGSSAGATHYRSSFEVGIAPIPQVDAANNPKVISAGPSLCMFNCGNAQENIATWLFMKFLVTNTNLQAAFAEASGYVPVLKSVSEVPTFAAKLEAANGGNNIAYLSMKVCLEQADYYYTSPAFNGSSTARDQVGYLMQAVMAGYTEASKTGSVDALIDKAFKDAINECKTRL